MCSSLECSDDLVDDGEDGEEEQEESEVGDGAYDSAPLYDAD